MQIGKKPLSILTFLGRIDEPIVKAVGCFDHVVPLLISSTGKWLQAGNFISVLSEQNKQAIL